MVKLYNDCLFIQKQFSLAQDPNLIFILNSSFVFMHISISYQMQLLFPYHKMPWLLPLVHADVRSGHDNEWMKTSIKWQCHIKMYG